MSAPRAQWNKARQVTITYPRVCSSLENRKPHHSGSPTKKKLFILFDSFAGKHLGTQLCPPPTVFPSLFPLEAHLPSQGS